MIHMRRLSIAMVLALVAWDCASDSDTKPVVGPVTNSPTGVTNTEASGARYQYQAYDSEGKHVVKGVMTIIADRSGNVTGEWRFFAVGDPSRIGPQVGTGSLVGIIEGGRVSINLNPRYADNNVILFGTISRVAIAGTWEFIGFPGVLAKGSFRAVKLAVRSLPND